MKLEGSLVAIATPFRDGIIDAEAYRRLIEFQIENGTNGIVPCGTTGESATLTHAEHAHLVELTCEIVDGRVPVIAGTGSNSTHEALRLTADAKAAGADASLLITPYYNKPNQEGLKAHFFKIADEVGLPLVLYNVPGRTAVSMTPATVAELSSHEQVIAVKDATANLDWTSEVAGNCDITILSGDDSAALAQMVLGAKGVISVMANVAPAAVAELTSKALAGDWLGARAVHHKYFKLMKLLFIDTNPIPVKAALEMMEKLGPELRLPLTPLEEAKRPPLEAEMKNLGLL